MLGFLFAFLAALTNAAASVLQRKANRDEPPGEEMSLRLVSHLLRSPVWLAGIGAVTAGFLLQAAALSHGQLAAVEPLLVLELPITIIVAWRVFGGVMTLGEWLAIGGMTIGLIGLIFFLSPTGGHSAQVPWWKWLIGIGVTAGVMAALTLLGRRTRRDMTRGAIYGMATGTGFGLTAALIKGVTNAERHGFSHVFTAWQTYLMIAAGAASMYLLQNALNAGKLVAAQPGITMSDPVVSILFGTLIFGEGVRHGLYMLLAVLSFALMVGSVVGLARSPMLQDMESDARSEGGSGDGDYAPASAASSASSSTSSTSSSSSGSQIS